MRKNPINEITWRQLRYLLNKFGNYRYGTSYPTFEELLDLLFRGLIDGDLQLTDYARSFK